MKFSLIIGNRLAASAQSVKRAGCGGGMPIISWFIMLFVLCSAAPFSAAAQTSTGLEQVVQSLSFANNTRLLTLLLGLFLGVMFTASAYLFFIWIVMRDRGQIFLLALVVSLTIYIASTNNVLLDQFGANTNISPDNMRALLVTVSMILACVFGTMFTYYFLDVETNLPAFKWPIYAFCVLMCTPLLYVLFDLSLVLFVLPAFSTTAVALILIVGIVCFHKGVSGSITHILAFVFFFIGMLADPLYVLGFLPNTNISSNLTSMSFSMAALMFSIVTASQFATRQEEKERALAISNERFMLTTRGANEGLFDWVLDTGDVFFSDQFRRVTSYDITNNVAGLKLWLRMVMPTDRRVVREAMRRFRRNPKVSAINLEYRVILPSGEKRWLHTKLVAVRHQTRNHVTRLVGSINDITARKQNEVALRASEVRFRSITEAHPVPVLIVGMRDGIIFYASPSADVLLGYKSSLLGQISFNRLVTDASAWQEILSSLNDGKEVTLKEIKLRRADNIVIDAALSARRISYEGQDAMVIGLYDLTERKTAEEQIARQQEALQQSEKMAALGGLLAGVAHELNNPLSVVIGQASLMIDSNMEPSIVTRADKIFKAADRCARIVKSFLALARRKPPQRTPMAINDIINSSLELLGYQIRTAGVEVELKLNDKLPTVIGDSDQMTQVVTNLILNAAQAMANWEHKRKITVTTDYVPSAGVVFTISDTGPGVPAEIRKRIFEPFFTTKGQVGGTGVGLSLCLNIVASHGGQILLEEAEGGGASFVVTLPMTEVVTETKEVVADQTITLPPLSILLVDDEIEIAQTLAELLESDHHTVDVAINGAIALEKLKKAKFDVIVSDLRMPVLDGPGLYEGLRKDFPEYVNKIIYVTGDTLSAHVQTFLATYPLPVVEKPYRYQDVCVKIKDIINDNTGN